MECPSCGNPSREGARFCDSCGAPLDAPAPAPAAIETPPGIELPEAVGGGRYRIERFLGQGARKNVFLARDTEEDREVAVSVFDTEGMTETVRIRARREAEATGRLGRNPHIVSVYDAGEDDERPFIVSQYMAGGDLEDVLDEAPGRRLEVERALAYAIDICLGLEHAHGRGVVHRDLKPANIWFDEAGSAQIGDFGLAATGAGSRQAGEGVLVGTVAYLPPEQALGRRSDARSDVYSLGAVLHEMLSGQPPFGGDDAVSIISQHLHADPLPPSRHNPTVPAALDRLVLTMLAKSASDRPESAAAVRAELERIAATAADPESADEAEGAEPGEQNPLDRLAGGVFVGRDRELEELRGAVDEAIAGRGSVLLVVGEPGIGKTRTSEELATYARVRGAKVHWGRCHEGEGAPAYWPWAEAVRSYVREADPVGLAWEIGSTKNEIAQIVPELGERLDGVEPVTGDDPEQARFRLFDAMSQFLLGAARGRPMVIVLDDLHWADEPSLRLLKFISRQLTDSGLLIVATYRDVELGRHHPLAKTLSTLSATENSRRVVLRGLDEAAVSRYIEMTIGTVPPAGLAAAVHSRTEGNPFFVAETVRLMASEGTLDREGGWDVAIPQGVREVVGRRLDLLSPAADGVLTLAAAIGREFEGSVLGRLVAETDAELADLLEEGVEARVLASSDRSPGRYSFTHALIRETLYEELSAPKRIELHRRIGAALEEHYGTDLEPHLAELSRHFVEAAPGGDAEKAIDYAERAARRAVEQLAHEEAAEHLARALEVMALSEERDRARELAVRLELAEEQIRAGRFSAAAESLEATARIARELGDAEALALAALRTAAISETGSMDAELVALIDEALEAIGPGDSATRSLLLSSRSTEEYWEDPQGQARPTVDEALEIARRIDDPEAMAKALAARQFLLVTDEGAANERLANADELLAVSEACGNRDEMIRARAYRITSLLEKGEVSAADRELEAYARIAAELREPRNLWHVPIIRAGRAIMDGDFDEAIRLSTEGARMGEAAEEPLSAQFSAIQISILRTLQGRGEEMLPLVRQMVERYPAIVAWRMALTGFLIEGDRLDEARVEYERLMGAGLEAIPMDTQWIVAVSRLADCAYALDDDGRAEMLYQALHPFREEVVVIGRAAATNGPVARALGVLALTLGRVEQAVAHLESAIAISSRMGDRPWLTDARLRLAEALLKRDNGSDRSDALELLGGVIDDCQEMGMRTRLERAVALRLEAQGVTAVGVTTSIDSVISAVESERPDIAAHVGPDGRVAIVFSDIENSTLMTERLGDERWIEVLRRHNSIFRERISEHRGFEVKNQGDGFMLVFPDAGAAVAAAIAVQRDFDGADVSEEERIRVRMGIHVGEAIQEEGDFFGRTVILAARIAAQAAGGEILVSDEVREAGVADGDGDGEADRFGDERLLELKGLAGAHRVYLARWQAEAQPA